MKVTYFTLYGDDFFPLCNTSKPSSLFKKKHTHTKKEKTTHHYTELSISPPHLYNHFLVAIFFFSLLI